MNKELSQKVLEKIKEEHILPQPKWQVDGERFLYWAATSVVSLLAGVLISIILLHIVQFFMGPKPFRIEGRPPQFFIYTFPYIWFFGALTATAIGVYVVKKMPKGYRRSTRAVSGGVILTVVFVAICLHIAHLNDSAERFLDSRGPKVLGNFRESQWTHPEAGFLGGRVLDFNQQEITVITRQGGQWKIVLGRDTTVYGKERLALGKIVFAEGTKEDEGIFFARVVKIGEGKPGDFDDRRREMRRH